MVDLWVHYPSEFYPDIDEDVRRSVEDSGGKWFGSGMPLSGECEEGRDNSFTFKVNSDLDRAIDVLENTFTVKHMRTSIQPDRNNLHSYHYMITPIQ